MGPLSSPLAPLPKEPRWKCATRFWVRVVAYALVSLVALACLCDRKARANPAEFRGFEPWYAEEPLYLRGGLLPDSQSLANALEKAHKQLGWCTSVLSATHPSTAQAEAELGLLLVLDPNRWTEAETVLERARKALSELPGDRQMERLHEVTYALGLLLDLQGLGHTPRARDLVRAAARMEDRVRIQGDLPHRGEERRRQMHLVAALHFLSQGKPQRAEALLATLPTYKGSTNKAELVRQAALFELHSLALFQKGRTEDGLRTLREAAHALEGGDVFDRTAAQNNLASLLYRASHLDEAETVLRGAYAQRQRAYGEHDPRTAPLARNLAILAWNQGELSKAESLLKAALQSTASLPPTSPEALQTLLFLGAVQRIREGPSPATNTALVTLRKVQQLAGDKDLAIFATEQVALVLLAQGRIKEAADELAPILFARPVADRIGGTRLQLRLLSLFATIEEAQGNAGAALGHLQRAQVLLGEAMVPSYDPLRILIHGQLGALLLRSGAAAPPPLFAGKPIAAETGPSREALLRGANQIGLALSSAAALQSSLRGEPTQLAQDALSLTQSSLYGSLFLYGLSDLSPPEEAVTGILRAVDGIQLKTPQRSPKLDDLAALYEERAATLLQPPQPLSPLYPEAAFVRDQKITQLEAQRMDKPVRPTKAEVEAALSQKQGVLVVVVRGLLPQVEIPNRVRSPARVPLTLLERGGRVLPPLRGPGDTSEQVKLISAATAAGTSKEQYGALVLAPSREARLLLLGDAGKIDGALSTLLQNARAQKETASDLRAEMANLGELLLSALDPLLPPGRPIYLHLPPELSALPVSALPLPDGKPLGSRGTVHLLVDLAELLEKPKSFPEEKGLAPLLLLGSPHLQESPPYLHHGHLQGLDGYGHGLAPSEMLDVEQLLRYHHYDPRGGPILGLAATKSRLSAWLPSRIVHLLAPLVLGDDDGRDNATLSRLRARSASLPFVGLLHKGVTPPVSSGVTGMALAAYYPKEGEPRDEGLLSPGELSEMDLVGTRLLVLSGPVVAGPQRMAGVGLARLVRAAKAAGATQVLLTLWRPDANVARQIMGEVYASYLRSGDLRTALREVQLRAAKKGIPPRHFAHLSAF